MNIAAPCPGPCHTGRIALVDRPIHPAYRWAALACAVVLAINADTATAQTRADPTGPSALLSQQVLVQVNAYRARQGLAPLQADAALARIAHGHSETMARRGHLGHDGFAQRFARADAPWCVENLGAGTAHAAELVAAWRASPGHDDNLRDARITRAGLASVAGYVTLLACEGAPVAPDDPPR